MVVFLVINERGIFMGLLIIGLICLLVGFSIFNEQETFIDVFMGVVFLFMGFMLLLIGAFLQEL